MGCTLKGVWNITLMRSHIMPTTWFTTAFYVVKGSPKNPFCANCAYILGKGDSSAGYPCPTHYMLTKFPAGLPRDTAVHTSVRPDGY